jgi:hypothetical protein
MSRTKLRIQNTEVDNLVSNLRGEVGSIIFSWVLMRDLLLQMFARRAAPDVDALTDPQVVTLRVLADKLEDEIVASLSELAARRIGRLTFHFASAKLGGFDAEVQAFQHFVRSEHFVEKRNANISHKEVPERWSDHREIHIPYPTLVRGIAMALRLMKNVDAKAVGPEAPAFWRKLRERRYERKLPPRVAYMLGPYIKLSRQERVEIMNKELQLGKAVWETASVPVNGQDTTVSVCKKWAAVRLEDRVVLLDQYPLIELGSITIGPAAHDPPGTPGNA